MYLTVGLSGSAAKTPSAAQLTAKLRKSEKLANRAVERLSWEYEDQAIEERRAAAAAQSDQLGEAFRKAIPWALGAAALGVGVLLIRRRRKAR